MALRRVALIVLVLGSLLGCDREEVWPYREGLTRLPPDRNADAVLNELGPALINSKKAGRVYYRGVCEPRNGYQDVSFPETMVHRPSKDKAGLVAIQDIFRADRDVKVTEEPPGLVRVRIGEAPDAILQTKISILTLRPIEQYNGGLVIGVMYDNEDVKAAMEELGVRLPPKIVKRLLREPWKDLPHLPPTMTDVTIDQMLDRVATTFNAIVLYGACEQQPVFDITLVHLSAFFDVPPGAERESR